MDSLTFYTKLQTTDEGREYLNLVNRVKSERKVKVRGDGNEYHHVHPKGLGGLQSGETILLTPFEHCLAHVLLAKAIPCAETLYPVSLMSESQFKKLTDLDKVTLEQIYGWSTARQKAFEYLHSLPFTEERLQKMSESHRGKTTSRKGQQLSSEHKKALSDAWTGKPKPWLRGKKHPKRVGIFLGNRNKLVLEEELQAYLDSGWQRGKTSQTREKISKKAKDRIISEETRKKISEKTRGVSKSEQHRKAISEGRKGIVFSEEHKKHISEARKHVSSGTKGKRPMWKEGKKRWFKPEEIQQKQVEGWGFYKK